MQEWWRTVLRLRFFYLRELLLGVLVWERKLLATDSVSHLGGEKKNLRGDQVGISSRLADNKSLTDQQLENQDTNQTTQLSHQQVTIKVANYPQEQEIFSSDKYQKSVHCGLTGELSVDNAELVDNRELSDDSELVDDAELADSKSSSWTAIGVMLEKRKKNLALLPVNDRQIGQKVEVNDKILPDNNKVVLDSSRSIILDFSKPSRRQFLLDVLPVGLIPSKAFKRQSPQESKTKSSWKMLGSRFLREHDEASTLPVGMLTPTASEQHDGKKDRVNHDEKKSRVDQVKKTVDQSRHSPSLKRKTTSKRKSLSYWLSWLLIAGGVIIALTYVVPDLYFKIAPADVIRFGEVKGSQNESPAEAQATPTPTPTPYVPPIDPDLPAGQWLMIPEIGVKTQPQATEDPEVALKDGVWIAPEYGQIGQPGMPIIMAAHRFGWKWWWQSDYWKLNSFYNLPETKPGTIVELIADQRKWTYLIYGGEEGDAITDYGADLILYTCKFLNSPIRHVRYARLIDPARPEVVLNQNNHPLSDEEKTELGKLFSLPY